MSKFRHHSNAAVKSKKGPKSEMLNRDQILKKRREKAKKQLQQGGIGGEKRKRLLESAGKNDRPTKRAKVGAQTRSFKVKYGGKR